jgi:hypothetical protein
MDDRTCTHPQWKEDNEAPDYRVTVEWRLEPNAIAKATDLNIPGLKFLGIRSRIGYTVIRYRFDFENTENYETGIELEKAIENELEDMIVSLELHHDHFANTSNWIDYEPI